MARLNLDRYSDRVFEAVGYFPAGVGFVVVDARFYGLDIFPDFVGYICLLAGLVRLPVRRWGGNSTTRYNWQIDVYNTGLDWYFENIPTTPGRIDQFVAQDQGTGTETILTMPLIGWTPHRRVESHPYDCGFKISVYGAQDDADWSWDPDCGNGRQGGVIPPPHHIFLSFF